MVLILLTNDNLLGGCFRTQSLSICSQSFKRYLYTGRDNLRTESTLLGEGEHKMKQINTTGHHKQASEILPITPAAINSLAM